MKEIVLYDQKSVDIETLSTLIFNIKFIIDSLTSKYCFGIILFLYCQSDGMTNFGSITDNKY
jgi:hypothetical protein